MFVTHPNAIIGQLSIARYALNATTVQDKHWITVTSTQDKELNDKARGRAYEIGASRYDAIFAP